MVSALIPSAPVARADILEVISTLSSDEIFTPPTVADAALDLLPSDVWADPELRWVDPGAKSGIFLREITRRLLSGLEEAIPDPQERLEHILREMVFGIAITELTSLMARRSLYCSKDAAGERSAVQMSTSKGNIWFQRAEHSFAAGRCTECGASEREYGTGEGSENYAYGFIHQAGDAAIREDIGMKFDVVVGNPPYQISDGGGRGSAAPVYDLFVQARGAFARATS